MSLPGGLRLRRQHLHKNISTHPCHPHPPRKLHQRHPVHCPKPGLQRNCLRLRHRLLPLQRHLHSQLQRQRYLPSQQHQQRPRHLHMHPDRLPDRLRQLFLHCLFRQQELERHHLRLSQQLPTRLQRHLPAALCCRPAVVGAGLFAGLWREHADRQPAAGVRVHIRVRYGERSVRAVSERVFY